MGRIPACLEASESEEAVPAPYRFSLAPARNGKCNVFRPNALSNAEAARPAVNVMLVLRLS